MSTFTKYLLIISLSTHTVFAACNTKSTEKVITETYTISGTVENVVPDGTIVLSSFDPISQVKTPIGTAVVDGKGHYQISYTFHEPTLYRVDIYKKQNVMLVVGEGQSDIILDVEGKSKGRVSIKGSPDSEKLLAYDNFRLESNARLVKPTYAAMQEASKSNDHEAEIEAVENYAHASEEHRVELLDFTSREIGTSLALYGSMLRWTGDEEIDRLDKLVSAFKKVHPNLSMTKVMEDKVNRFRNVSVGAMTPSIELADSSGQMITLESLKGKYTLIDFWASWCGPCLLQIPDLKDAYKEFNKDGFEIVGVSVDNNGSRWKKAIIKYEMAWPQLSDLKGWGSEAAAAYNVTFIPFNVLIDSKGKIIAKNLHSKALNKKLTELLR
ncbi:AhpC/TSA family protein [Saprospiraceae bacterium]|nr:AhpC/TSA family protein [Saprospiraceae bacterium]